MTTLTQPSIPILDLSPETDALWDELQAAMARVLRSGQFILGPEVAAFEREVADYLGVKHAVGVNSGTDALIIGLRALGVGPGDEVLTTAFSFFATAEAISNVGATPVFVDVEEDSFNLDPDQIEERITPRTKAVLPVHLYGRPCNMDAILALAAAHDLLVIEDCAQSFGARRGGRQTGTFGDAGAFSFYPTKNLGAYGDGGLVVTDRPDMAETARMLRTHGARKKYQNEVLGYNSRLDALQAAILRVKLPHVDAWNEGRRAAARTYNALLAELPGVLVPDIEEDYAFHQYTLRLTDSDRDRVHEELAKLGVSTMVYYPVPQDRLPVYRGKHPANPVSDLLATQVLSLPMWPGIPLETQERVVAALRGVLPLCSPRDGGA